MANQDDLTITRKDPSGAYDQIEAGWNPTYADGVVTWRPTSSSFTTLVADTGVQTLTYSKAASASGWSEANPDTFQIPIPAGSTVSTDYISIVVTENTGTAGNDTFTLASSEIASISAGGLVTFGTGTGVFVTECVMEITYKADIDEAVATNSSEAICVKGATGIHIYHPASGNAEVTAKFQWTDDEDLSIDGTAKANWQDITSATASAQAKLLIDPSDNTEWAKLDKMAYIRLTAISTDANVDGVADVTAYEHNSSGAYIQFDRQNALESNTGVSISGIGADPS